MQITYVLVFIVTSSSTIAQRSMLRFFIGESTSCPFEFEIASPTSVLSGSSDGVALAKDGSLCTPAVHELRPPLIGSQPRCMDPQDPQSECFRLDCDLVRVQKTVYSK